MPVSTKKEIPSPASCLLPPVLLMPPSPHHVKDMQDIWKKGGQRFTDPVGRPGKSKDHHFSFHHGHAAREHGVRGSSLAKGSHRLRNAGDFFIGDFSHHVSRHVSGPQSGPPRD